MLYDDLPEGDKKLLAAIERNTRGWLNGLAALLAQARALDAAWSASGGADDLVASLDAAQVVPNSSGIGGAQDLTKEEWNTMRTSGLTDFLVKYDTDAVRRVLAKAAGPTAGQ